MIFNIHRTIHIPRGRTSVNRAPSVPAPRFAAVFLVVALVIFAVVLSPEVGSRGRAHASLISSSVASQKSLNNGLVGYWTFDGKDVNWKTGQITDASGAGHTAQMINMSTTTSPAAGKAGQGLKLSGASEYVAINLGSQQSTFTTSFWWRPDQSTNSSGYWASNVIGFTFGRDQLGDSSRFFRWYSTGGAPKLQSTFNNGGGNATSSTHAETGNVWYQYTFVHLPSEIDWYSNGVFVNSIVPTASTFDAMQYIKLGGTGVSGQSINGILDDVRVYSRALSPTEIAQLYSQGAGGKYDVAPKQTISNGLLGYWTFDGKDTNWATGKTSDVSGNGNTGQMQNIGTTTGSTGGKLGQAFNFNGGSSCVNFFNNSSLKQTGAVSVSAWIKQNSSALGRTAAGIGDVAGAASTIQYILYDLGSNRFTFLAEGVNAGGNVSASSAINSVTTNAWNHLVGTYDGAGNIKLYVNGALAASGASSTMTTLNSPATTGFAIGGSAISANSCFRDFFNGVLDDVHVYNRALSQTDVSQLYSSGAGKYDVASKRALTKGLVGYWTFDGKDVNWKTGQITDASGGGNTARLINMSTTTSPVAGKVGQAIGFKGASKYIDVSSAASHNALPLSVAFWFKTDGSSQVTFPGIVSKYASGSSNGWWTGIGQTANTIVFWYYKDASNNIPSASSGTFSLNVWHHAVIVFDTTGGYVYVDGARSGSVKAWTGTPGADTSSQNLQIGAYSGSASTQYFGGSVDDVRIYNRILSATEVVQLYNMGR